MREKNMFSWLGAQTRTNVIEPVAGVVIGTASKAYEWWYSEPPLATAQPPAHEPSAMAATTPPTDTLQPSEVTHASPPPQAQIPEAKPTATDTHGRPQPLILPTTHTVRYSPSAATSPLPATPSGSSPKCCKNRPPSAPPTPKHQHFTHLVLSPLHELPSELQLPPTPTLSQPASTSATSTPMASTKHTQLIPRIPQTAHNALTRIERQHAAIVILVILLSLTIAASPTFLPLPVISTDVGTAITTGLLLTGGLLFLFATTSLANNLKQTRQAKLDNLLEVPSKTIVANLPPKPTNPASSPLTKAQQDPPPSPKVTPTG